MRHLSIRNSISLIMVLGIILSMLFVSTAFASEASDSYPHVNDKAGLLSTEETKKLEQSCIDYGKKAGIDIMILTHDDSDATDPETYIEDFEDSIGLDNVVYILVDMYNRKVFIEGYGTAETYIHSKRINAIITDITPMLKQQDYYNAFETYIEEAAGYMKDDTVINNDHNYNYNTDPTDTNSDYTSAGNAADNFLLNPLVQLVISLIVGGIAVGIMAYNSGGKMTTGGNTYMDSSNSGLIGRRDNYIRTVVTRIKKPDNNNQSGGQFNAGGFQGGISDGGSSHSSGGGSF